MRRADPSPVLRSGQLSRPRCASPSTRSTTRPTQWATATPPTRDTPLTVGPPGLLANDTDPDGDALVTEVASEPTHGELVVGPNGSFNYGPAPGYSGPDSFTYTVSDGNGGTDTASVSITVTPLAREAVADFNGDGTSDVAVFRPGTGTWHVRNQPSVTFGTQPGDIPVPADYDGNGTTDVAVFRSGTWHVRNQTAVTYGTQPGDVPVPGDHDGNGDADIAVYRPWTGTWHVRGQAVITHGTRPGDVPVPGDYDGDGDADIALFRPSTAPGSSGTRRR